MDELVTLKIPVKTVQHYMHSLENFIEASSQLTELLTPAIGVDLAHKLSVQSKNLLRKGRRFRSSPKAYHILT